MNSSFILDKNSKMTVEGSTIKSRIKSLLRSPSIKLRRSKPGNNKENLSNKVTLEKVLGITTSGNRALASDPRSGLVAYPAGCVVVLLNPKKNKQHHIVNSFRKTITTLSFSPDGKYMVTGESGHMPAVRVWDAVERTQVAELQEHKYGVACVAFSPNSKYIVSVGYQHDMIVNVWAWKKNVVVAANKVSSKVAAVSFSDDSSYFVTAGNRHIKFWYLDHTKSSKVNATVPLLGRSGLLGELRNNFFSDVACGKGRKADSTFCITTSGLLCEFNDKRLLDKWVELRTTMATSLSVTEDLIFCGCADGTVRAFSPINLHFICTLPRPHSLGTDIATVVEASHLFSYKTDARYPDTVAVSYDPTNRWLSCVYNDHSLYVWDVRDLRKVGKVYSAMYHSACVWSVEMYPEPREGEQPCLPLGSFLTCSSDNTVRQWNTDTHNASLSRNLISNDLQKVIYMDNSTSALLDPDCTVSSSSTEKADPQTSENRTGIRTMCVSPDGQHLASGDRNGTLRIHELECMEEIMNVQAHDSEILCLEYSKPETGFKLLATASRDRLIHVLDAEREYGLVQTLDEHSSSITAVRFAANDGKVRMISCGADKSIYFRTAQKTDEGTVFTRTHHIVRKTTLYDMDIDPTHKYAAIGCQDRSIRIFNISNGKQKKLYKGSQGEDGTLLKVQTDPSGLYVATSCSDKNISIFDFYTGECVATMFGHSEIVTGMKFTNDCKHLITVSGDSCIFVWRLSPELTINMRQRLSELKNSNKPVQKTPPHKPIPLSTRREVHSAPAIATMSSDSDKEVEEEEGIEEEDEEELAYPLTSSGSSTGEDGSSEERHNSLNSYVRDGKKEGSRRSETSGVSSDGSGSGSGPRPRRRWSRRIGNMELMVKSMLDLRQLESFAMPPSPIKTPIHERHTEEQLGSTISLQTIHAWGEDTEERQNLHPRPQYIRLASETSDIEPVVLYPEGCDDRVSLAGSEYQVKETIGVLGRSVRGVHCHDKHSPDSACSVDYSSRLSSPEHPGEDTDPTEPLSVDGNSSELDMEELEEEEEVFQKSEPKASVPQTPDQEAFLKMHFGNLSEQNTPTSPTRAPPCITDSVSMSAKFLYQTSTSRNPFPFLSKASADPKAASGVVRPLVSEVRPLMEERSASPVRLEVERAPQKVTPTRCTPQKKRPSVDNRRAIGPVAKAVAVHGTGGGMRKSQSATQLNILVEAEASQSPSRPSKEVAPQPHVGDRVYLTTPRHTLPSAPTISSPTSPTARDGPTTPTGPKPKSRSYMSPTTSSMAKMSRSMSMGECLNMGESGDDASSSSENRRGSGSESTKSGAPSTKTTVPMVLSPTGSVTSPSGVVTPHAAVIPTLNASASGGKALPGKLPGSTLRPQLSLDMSKPLPDKPSVASFSPNGKSSKPIRGESTPLRSPASINPLHGSSQNQPPALSSNIQPVAALCSNSTPEVPQESVQPALCAEQNQTSEKPAESRQTSSQGEERTSAVPETNPTVAGHFGVPVPASPSPSPSQSSQEADPSVNIDACRVAASDLQSSIRRACQLYRMVNSGPSSDVPQDQLEMARVLTEALDGVRAELNTIQPFGPNPPIGAAAAGLLCAVGGRASAAGEDKTMALLEQYSELLLRAVERRMDNKC
ncbi:mitogen-activated protein kinase-binding protein 1 isoform X3 [Alosa sapidissima]|uniref:mitogen-activated protein kinase-binding protein 1 isoform X3 n=1 Tax=Alosa sapidissima TaxID=34773 RepID=UPI001C09C1C4|nr:mitogen-activated protein kinase-binding protein 1 isoform X3 [Alosa sapidissima]